MGNDSNRSSPLPTMGEDVTGDIFGNANGINNIFLENRPSKIFEKVQNGENVTAEDASIDHTELTSMRESWEAPSERYYGESRGVESIEMRGKRMEILRKIDELISDSAGVYSGYREDVDKFVNHLEEYTSLVSEYERLDETTPEEQQTIPQLNPTLITQTPSSQERTITSTQPTNPRDIHFIR